MKTNWNANKQTEAVPQEKPLTKEEKAAQVIDLIAKLYGPLTKSEWCQIANGFESGLGDTYDDMPYELFSECTDAAIRRAK